MSRDTTPPAPLYQRWRPGSDKQEKQPAPLAWVPGGATPAPQPGAVWPQVLGVLVAISAQGVLYLALRHLAIASMPAWAHHAARHGPLPWPAMVAVDVVHGRTAPPGQGGPALPAPVLQPAPVIEVKPPHLDRNE